MNHHDFFGPAAAAMPREFVDDPSITAYTDGLKIVYGRPYVNTLNVQQTVGLIIHELLHPLLDHLIRLVRQFEADPHRANVAADYEVNNLVETYNKEATFPIVLPPEALVDVEKWKALAAEVIYKKILEEEPPPPPPPPPPKPPEGDEDGDGEGEEDGKGKGEGKGSGSGKGQPQKDGKGGSGKGQPQKDGTGSGTGQKQQKPSSAGEFRPAKDPAKAKEISEKWREILSSSIQTAKLRGKGGGKFIEKLEELMESPLDLESLLEKYTTEFCMSDESIRADKRHLAYHDLFITGIEDEQHGTLVFVKDTSGSITTPILQSVVSIVQSASNKLRPRRVIVMDVDAEVQHVEEFMPNDEIPLVCKGRGGTDFRPAFDFIENNLEEARVIIYLTDGYGVFPEEEPSVPTLWITYGLDEVDYPFGQVVNMNELIDQSA